MLDVVGNGFPVSWKSEAANNVADVERARGMF